MEFSLHIKTAVCAAVDLMTYPIKKKSRLLAYIKVIRTVSTLTGRLPCSTVIPFNMFLSPFIHAAEEGIVDSLQS
jgi:hypothetical protein